jgi:aminoglycoside/choline kinase family phosphotransferase
MKNIPPEAVRAASALFGGKAPLKWRRLAPDASARCFWRLQRADRSETRVLMSGPDRQENLAWLLLGRELWLSGLPLPRIFGALPEEGCFLMEDLGDVRLDSLAAALEPGGGPPGAGAAMEAWRGAVRTLAAFHARALPAVSRLSRWFSREYDPPFALEFEWGYFLSGLRLLKIPFAARPSSGDQVLGLAEALCAGPKVFIHRDYQSRNIMLKNGGPRIVDWQGGRLGPAAYDLASLLWDPYVSLSDGQRGDLARLYLEEWRAAAPYGPDAGGEGGEGAFLGRLMAAAFLRLSQAFGAYAKLSAAGGRPEYARHLAPAAWRLWELAEQIGLMTEKPLRAAAQELGDRAGAEPEAGA